MSSTITILGSTGSIGVTALRVIRSLGSEFRVHGLTCQKNLKLFEKQIEEFRPAAAAVGSPEIASSREYRELRSRYPDVEFLEREEGLLEIARRRVDILLSAIVGAAGLRPTIAAVPHAKRIALANKETLVMAGVLFMQKVREHGVELLPVDSEHSAVFSLLRNIRTADVRRVLLTASGGSLRDRPAGALDSVTPEEALAHPTWSMGEKISIDSSTLMNKGLEVIEAHHLFGLDYDAIGVIIHPESIIHSMVETVDGAVYAHMGVADMAFPVLNALVYPERRDNSFGKLDLEKVGHLHFNSYDAKKFPALRLCYRAGRTGGSMPAVLNAANEVAVELFLRKKILFTDIVAVVEKTMERHAVEPHPDLDAIFSADGWARETARSIIRG